MAADGTAGTDPTTTTLDAAYGAASNTFAVYGQEVASASNISEGGAASEVQHLVLDSSTAIATGDTFSITVDGTVYTTEALAGDGVSALVTALNAAKDSTGTVLNTVLTATSSGNDITLTWTGTADHQNGTTLFKSGQYAGEATGTDTGTNSHNTVIGGEGNDVLVLGAGTNNLDHVVLSGNFGNDVVMNFDTGVDKFDVSAYASSTLSNTIGVDTANLVGVTDYLTALNGKGVTAGNNIMFVENTGTAGVNDYYVFQITAAGSTVAAGDTVTLLGTVTTADGTIAAGDIVIA